VIARLRSELRTAGRREIGGVLMGEHVEGGTFRIVEISVQRSGGTVAHFERDPEHHRVALAEFFARTRNEFTRFNYLGEWHSHPSFPAVPSLNDIHTMQRLVEDADVGVNFAVLFIARLRLWGRLETSANAFRPHAEHEPVELILDRDRLQKPRSIRQRISGFFRV